MCAVRICKFISFPFEATCHEGCLHSLQEASHKSDVYVGPGASSCVAEWLKRIQYRKNTGQGNRKLRQEVYRAREFPLSVLFTPAFVAMIMI